MEPIAELKVIAGPACSTTLRMDTESKISSMLEKDFKLMKWQDHHFIDGEYLYQLGESVRGADIYIVQPTYPPDKNQVIIEQMLHAASLASGNRIIAVLPYMGGLRQDRKDRPRVSITAALNAQKIEVAMQAASSKHVMILHPHFPQVQGFFRISSDLLYPTDILQRKLALLLNDFSNVVPVAPDPGAAKLAGVYAKRLNTTSLAIGDKRRDEDDKAYIRDIIGDVAGKIAVVFEDIIDTANTICKLAKKLCEKDVKEIYVFATHGIFARGSIENLKEAQAKAKLVKVIVTDSIDHTNDSLPEDLIEVVRCGELIGEAIYRDYTRRSISAIAGMY